MLSQPKEFIDFASKQDSEFVEMLMTCSEDKLKLLTSKDIIDAMKWRFRTGMLMNLEINSTLDIWKASFYCNATSFNKSENFKNNVDFKMPEGYFADDFLKIVTYEKETNGN